MDRSDVFLSYRRKDVDFVKLVDQALKKSGREVWVDWEDIPPGVEGFADEIQKGIEGADAFIAVLSPSYLESEYCLMELREALRLKKRIVPIVYLKFEPAPPPEGIGHINWVYFTPHAGQENTFDQAFPKVIQALEADYEHAREHTRLLLRALDWDKHSRNTSYLLKGAEIEKAESWQVAGSAKDPSPTQMQGEYILLSRKQQRRQQQMFTGVIGIFLVLAAIAAIFALFQASEARRQESIAVAAQAEAEAASVVIAKNAEVIHSNALASAAQLPGNERIATALALEATRSENAPAEVFEMLADITYQPGSLRYVLYAPADDYISTRYPAVSPDGRFVVLRSTMYDLTTGEVVRTFDQAPGYVLTGIYLADGKEVILAGDDDGVLDPKAHPVLMGRYDAETGKLLQKYDTGVGVADIQLSGDGKTLISYMPDNTAVWWNVATGAKIRQFDDVNRSLRFSPDLQLMAQVLTGETDGSMTDVVKNTETMEEVVSFPLPNGYKGYNDMTETQTFSPDSSQIVVGGSVYSLPGGQYMYSFGQYSSIYSTRFSPDGLTVMTAAGDGTVIVSDSLTGDEISRQTAHATGSAGLRFADYTAGGERAVSFDILGVMMEWDLLPGNQISHHETTSLTGSPDGHYSAEVVDGENDGLALAITDTQTNTQVAKVPVPASPQVNFGTTLDNSKMIYQVNEPADPDAPGKVVIASLMTGETLAELPMNAGESFGTAWLLPDNQRIVLSYSSGTDSALSHLELRDIASNKVLLTYVEPFTGYTLPVISPDFTHMLIAITETNGDSQKASLRMVEMETGKTLFTWDRNYEGVWFTPDGTEFLTPKAGSMFQGGKSVSLEVYDTLTGDLVRTLPGKVEDPSQVIFTPDGSSFFTGALHGGSGRDTPLPSSISMFYQYGIAGYVNQWDTATGRLLRKFPIESDDIRLTSDGKTLITIDYYQSAATKPVDIRWRLDTPAELVAWACANRYVAPLTTEQREKYSITSETSVCANLSASS